jgi:hypothetical protein
MTRYHFHALDGTALRDEEGEELPNLEAAQEVAVAVLTEMLPSRKEFWSEKMFSVAVKDDSGRLVAILTTVAVTDPSALASIPPRP